MSADIACKEATENIFGPLLEVIFKVKLLQCLMMPEEAAKLRDKKGCENFKRPSTKRRLMVGLILSSLITEMRSR